MKNKILKDLPVHFSHDNAIEQRIAAVIDEHKIDPLFVARNFPLFTRRTILKRFLALYQLFLKSVNLPGDLVELGVFKGFTLLSLANFLEAHNIGDRQKKVIGFDTFEGFPLLSKNDGAPDETIGKASGGLNSASFLPALEDLIQIFDQDRFIPWKPRIELIKGDICKTVPAYAKDNPGLRISFLFFDCDLYEPTKVGLRELYSRVVPGGVVVFDEYGLEKYPGETAAADEFLKGLPITLQKFDWHGQPGAYFIKP